MPARPGNTTLACRHDRVNKSSKLRPLAPHGHNLDFRLKDVQECVDVPKEVCVRAKVNPRKNKKPVIKKWCYTPTNAGSEDENNDNKVDEEDNLDSEGSGDDISQRG